jgi:hypothetical protein
MRNVSVRNGPELIGRLFLAVTISTISSETKGPAAQHSVCAEVVTARHAGAKLGHTASACNPDSNWVAEMTRKLQISTYFSKPHRISHRIPYLSAFVPDLGLFATVLQLLVPALLWKSVESLDNSRYFHLLNPQKDKSAETLCLESNS